MAALNPNNQFSFHRHRPERNYLYQVVEMHWPLFLAQQRKVGKFLPCPKCQARLEQIAVIKDQVVSTKTPFMRLRPRARTKIEHSLVEVLMASSKSYSDSGLFQHVRWRPLNGSHYWNL